MRDFIQTAVEEIHQAFVIADMHAIEKYAHEHIVWNMIGDQHVRGRQAFLKFLQPMQPMPEMVMDSMMIDGNKACCFGWFTMGTGDQKKRFSYCDTYEFENEKLIRLASYVIEDNVADAPDSPRMMAMTLPILPFVPFM